MNVYILLDRSGSMEPLWSEAVGSINGYVTKLSKDDFVHLAAFDSQYDVVRDMKVEDWVDIDPTQEIYPRGMTALYDSCGKIMKTAEEDNADKTILVVMTDGEENSSKEFKQQAIKDKVKAFEDRGWEVIFLGANFDRVENVSSSVGVTSSKTMNISAKNLRQTFDSFAVSSTAYATTGQSINFTAEDKAKAVSQ